MDVLHDLFKNLYVQIALLILFATFHGYAGAWLAVRMLFRPRRAVKVLGITVFPQGMIPRHRERLANAIGKAVGEELVSTETIHEQLIGRDFLKNKIQSVVDSYTTDLLSTEYPSLIEALPANIRPAVLDALAGLQRRLGEHVREMLSGEETRRQIAAFVTEQVDHFLSQRVSDVVDDSAFEKVVDFVDLRVRSAVASPALEANIADFVSRRLDDLIRADTPLAEMFTPDAIVLLKEKASDQVEPAIHHLTELAATEKTRDQISALIKHEVHDFYENLSFFKKIFVSRENLLHEVDELVNESFPKRIEETLRGTFFAEEARTFISTTIDKTLAKPLKQVIGNVAPEQLDKLKEQVTRSVVSLLRSEETLSSVSAYVRTTLSKLRPHSLDAILETLQPRSEEQLKAALRDGLIHLLGREETANSLNRVLADQIERLLARPIGRIEDHLPGDKVRDASSALTDAIIAAINAKLPDAIREFDVGGVVRDKIRTYPVEKLESLVMSVAREHLRTIELFGALFGFLIGVAQAVQFYFYAR